MSDTCEHDWRIDPSVILTSNPPASRLVCAKCGAVTSRVMGDWPIQSHDPADWAKAR